MKLAFIITISGLLVVFSVLILVALLIHMFGGISKRKQNQETVSHPSYLPQGQQQNPADSGDQDEIIAVISAAVSYMLESSGKSYAVKSIRRAGAERPIWAAAGVFENTRPF